VKNAAKPQPIKDGILEIDGEGKLPLPPDLFPSVKIGDDYAVWNDNGDIVMVFKKHGRWKHAIPNHAHFGKVEPALPEMALKLPEAAKTAKGKKRKAQPAKAADEMV